MNILRKMFSRNHEQKTALERAREIGANYADVMKDRREGFRSEIVEPALADALDRFRSLISEAQNASDLTEEFTTFLTWLIESKPRLAALAEPWWAEDIEIADVLDMRKRVVSLFESEIHDAALGAAGEAMSIVTPLLDEFLARGDNVDEEISAQGGLAMKELVAASMPEVAV